jgi:hypothetical protein
MGDMSATMAILDRTLFEPQIVQVFGKTPRQHGKFEPEVTCD